MTSKVTFTPVYRLRDLLEATQLLNGGKIFTLVCLSSQPLPSPQARLCQLLPGQVGNPLPESLLILPLKQQWRPISCVILKI